MSASSALLAAIAANRFGFGARPGELEFIAGDPRRWLLSQVEGRYRPPAALGSLASSGTILAQFLATRDASDDDPETKLVQGVRRHLLPHYLAQAEARTRIAIDTAESFRERLVHFWSNHFAVSVDKPIVAGIAGAMENEAIRPHVGGRFEDMLVAVETHPAMITYLDNQQSVGPGSALAGRARRYEAAGARQFGINENLAREILELHTLGVDGGYDQRDVTSFAEVLTGWSIGGGRGRLAQGEPGGFQFRPAIHQPGAQVVLGRRYAQAGFAQGRTLLADLARHPQTARHLATKLVRHFVADEPPFELVDRLTKAWLAGNGWLPAVYEALVTPVAAWQPQPRKFKTPHDFAVSALRAFAVQPLGGASLLSSFELLGQRHWSPGSPAGWPDRAQDWDGPDAIMKRLEWSVALADRVGHSHPAMDAGERALGPLLRDATRTAIARAESGSQALALLIMSPEFQRR
jgi:uncharacterized protein (DUF1800 family)